ncbi:MAG TPA: NHL repeat-containing protein [Mucilaginibacter sp.]|nr:NHL repeat-containing protein [Mucilaginibacter sp.]
MIKSFTKFRGISGLAILVLIALSSCSKKETPGPPAPPTISGTVTTYAGSGATGSDDGIGIAASFFFPTDIIFDAAGNMYVTDSGNNMIRKVTPAGVVSKFVGFLAGGEADGTGAAAGFHYPYHIAIDAAGNLYVTDQGNVKVRKITPAGVVTTFAGTGQVGFNNGPGNQATFYGLTGITVDATGNVYVSDQGNSVIRKITPAGVVSTFAGTGSPGSADGTGTAASFHAPSGLAIDAAGNLYVSDAFNNKIRKITTAGVVTTIAGSGVQGSADGTGTAATFYSPSGITVDVEGNIFVTEASNKIRRINPAGTVTTFAGNGIAANVNAALSLASFSGPTGVAIDPVSKAVFVADKNNNLIRKLVP